MNKKEINEIRRTFKPDFTVIDKVVTAFINPVEHTIMSYEKVTLLQMEEEMFHKYIDLGKGTLGGKLEKNLLNIPVSDTDIAALRNDGLTDDNIVRAFLAQLADTYDCGSNIMVTLMHGAYDIPIKTSDNLKLDESDETFDFILCTICPLKFEKAGLYFDINENKVNTVSQKLIVDKPMNGFMYPAFNDRSTDMSAMLYFTKKVDEIHPEFINILTADSAPISAESQKTIFEKIVSDVAGETSFNEEKALHDNIIAAIEDRQRDNKDLTISEDEMFILLSNSLDKTLERNEFERAYDNALSGYDKTNIALNNIIDIDSFNIAMADIRIKVNPERTDIIEQVDINGGKYFAIPVSAGIEINGKSVKG